MPPGGIIHSSTQLWRPRKDTVLGEAKVNAKNKSAQKKRYKDRKSMSREIGFSIVVSNSITT